MCNGLKGHILSVYFLFIYNLYIFIYSFLFIVHLFSCQLLHWLSKFFMFFCFDFVFFYLFCFKYQSLKFTLSPYEDTSKQI